MQAFSFEGNGFEYFKIWIVNILLIAVTLGLYYPWAKVRNRRYFCANSTLDGRNFEYHATGKQLFVGYLIAMAIFIVFVIIQNFSPIGSLVVAIGFVIALPWIIWRSIKFNMRMTSFSNVRFDFDGQLGPAYINFLLLPIVFFLALYVGPVVAVVVFTTMAEQMSGAVVGIVIAVVLAFLGLAFILFAYIKKRNTSYAIDGYRYGQGQFSTTLETKTFALIALKTIGLSILITIALMLLSGLLAAVLGLTGELLQLQGSMQDPEAMQSALGGGIAVLLILIYLGFIFSGFFIIAYSISRQRSYIYANSSLDDKITFTSTLGALSFAGVMITNLLIVIFTLGLGTPWTKVRLARLFLANTQVTADQGFDEYLTQKQGEQSSLGEQIGDAFDVDVGIGI